MADAVKGPGRRAVLALPALALPSFALAGCGFHPLYGSAGAGPGPARTGLGLISVALIPERTGQLLRQALQARLENGSAPPAKRYDLVVGFGIVSDGVGIMSDNTVTRVRFTGQASWSLVTRDRTRATVTTGDARAVDGLNTFDQQYFAQDLETETVQRRIAEQVADQITQQLAAWFVRHPV